MMLLRKELPEIKFIVPGYLTEGLTILAGKGKIGKSWLALGIAIAVACGGYALGSIKVEQGDVLYLALEDNERRLQKRLRQLFPRESPAAARLFYDLTCPPLDAGGIEAIREWIKNVPSPRLIVVDVLAKVRPVPSKNEAAYDADYRALGPLKQLADENGVAIIVVHHTRKAQAEDAFDAVSGSTGLTGAADATLVLSRNASGTTLYGRGRDLEEFEVALSFDKTCGHWSLLGSATEVRRSDARTTILRILRESPEPMRPADIARKCGMKPTNVRQLLGTMVRSAELTKVKPGLYAYSDHTDHTDHTCS
jgi:RecA-family ATPase